MDGLSSLLFWYKASEQIRRDLHVPAVITSRSYLPLGGIPLQNVVNFCCRFLQLGGYNGDSWASDATLFLTK